MQMMEQEILGSSSKHRYEGKPMSVRPLHGRQKPFMYDQR